MGRSNAEAAIRARALSVAGYLPARVITNDELAARLETSDSWIRQRTGIRRRHVAAPDELPSDMALAAAREALSRAGVGAGELDLILLATTTPDDIFPATATRLQHALGAPPIPAFDLQAVCAGFIYALATADAFMRSGQARRVLVVGVDLFSRLVDWTDRSTAVLFGDGAAAMVLGAEPGTGSAADRGLLACGLGADGAAYDLLRAGGGPGCPDAPRTLVMAGREVFRQAVARMSESAAATLAGLGLAARDLDWLIPHQANRRIIESIAERLEIPLEKVIITIENHGNTSAASVPLALEAGLADGRISAGDLLLLDAMGGGLAWGSAVLRW